jgi:hypothetical protein
MAWKATRRSRFPERRFAIPAAFNQLRQGVAQPLGLLFLDTLDTPSYTNAILQLALQGVAAQVNGSLKSAGVM